MDTPMIDDLQREIETVPTTEVRPHPQNYRTHPEDQLEHLMESIREHGLYRNIIVARDGTVLAGHGVLEAAERLGVESIPVVRLDVSPDDTRALKVLAGDNEIGHLAEIDDRRLSEILREVRDEDPEGLFGTGYDEHMLANLVFVTRPKDEVDDFDAAEHWVGMPEHDGGQEPCQVIVNTRSEEDRDAFLEEIGIKPHRTYKASGKVMIWWPERETEDLSSVRFEP